MGDGETAAAAQQDGGWLRRLAAVAISVAWGGVRVALTVVLVAALVGCVLGGLAGRRRRTMLWILVHRLWRHRLRRHHPPAPPPPPAASDDDEDEAPPTEEEEDDDDDARPRRRRPVDDDDHRDDVYKLA